VEFDVGSTLEVPCHEAQKIATLDEPGEQILDARLARGTLEDSATV